jgi:hypothetical protein
LSNPLYSEESRLKRLFFFLLLSPLIASAEPSSCYNFEKSDQMYFCLAVSQKSKADCFLIRDQVLKNECVSRFGGDSGFCESIRNEDHKYYCIANSKKQSAYCYSIREADSKNFCLAQQSNDKSYCFSIRAVEKKNQCLLVVK